MKDIREGSLWRPKTGEARIVKVTNVGPVSVIFRPLDSGETEVKDRSWFTTRFVEVKK